jgi:hypothetical protein
MAKKPDLLKEAVGALKAIKRLNYEIDKENDPPAFRAFKRVDRILAKAAAAA